MIRRLANTTTFNLVDLRGDHDRDHDAIFGPFGTHSLRDGERLVMTFAQTSWRSDLHARTSWLLASARCRAALEAAGAGLRWWPATLRFTRGRTEVSGGHFLAPIERWLPMLDEAASEFEPWRAADGSALRRVVDGHDVAAIRRCARAAPRDAAAIEAAARAAGAAVFCNAHLLPRAGPFVLDAVAQALARLPARGVEARAPDTGDPS